MTTLEAVKFLRNNKILKSTLLKSGLISNKMFVDLEIYEHVTNLKNKGVLVCDAVTSAELKYKISDRSVYRALKVFEK